MQFRKAASLIAVSAALALTGAGTASAFGGHGGGGHIGGGHLGGGSFGAGRIGGGGAARFGVGGAAGGRQFSGQRFGNNGGGRFAGNGGRGGFHGGRGFGGGFGLGYGLGYEGYGYDYDGADVAYDDGYGDSGYPDNVGPGVQYSQAPDEDEAGVQTGRSVATTGDTCSTPVKACTLYTQSYVGQSCSCKVPGGRSRGRVTP